MCKRIEQYLASLVESNRSGGSGLPTPSGHAEKSPDEGYTSADRQQHSESTVGDYGAPEDAFMDVIDAYFHYCHNQPYSFFHEDNFRERLSKHMIPKHLVLAVMSHAVRFCSHSYFWGHAHETSVEYANRAWKLIVSDCFTVGRVAEVSTVQTVALLGLFDFTGKARRQKRIED